MSDIEELRALANALHVRGIREKCLQRQIQKYLEIIPQVCTKHKDGKGLKASSEHMNIHAYLSVGFCMYT